jgi:hypothetical protein
MSVLASGYVGVEVRELDGPAFLGFESAGAQALQVTRGQFNEVE